MLAVAVAALAPGPRGMAAAQGLFAPVLQVNDRLISEYEVRQRMRFLQVLDVGVDDLREEAILRLTEEAVQMFHARRQGVRLTDDELAEGLAEFASRGEMQTDAFVAMLQSEGVARESFETFVANGLTWRKLVRERFLARVTISDSEIDRALSVAAIRGRERVLISELFLPTDPQFAEAVAEIVPQILELQGTEAFSEAARQVSIAGTREQGGQLDWLPLEALPAPVARALQDARPGQIIGPVEVPGAIGFFQLRGRDNTRDIPVDRIRVSYQRLELPGGRSEANLSQLAQIRARAERCTDLNLFARDLPPGALSAREDYVRALPQGDALELARLDPNEISATQTEAGALVVLMLCSRTVERDPPATRSDVRAELSNRRLQSLAGNYLAELMAQAEIRRR